MEAELESRKPMAGLQVSWDLNEARTSPGDSKEGRIKGSRKGRQVPEAEHMSMNGRGPEGLRREERRQEGEGALKEFTGRDWNH